MRAIRTNAFRSRLSALLAFLAGLCAIAGFTANSALAADEPRPPLAIQFSLDRPIDAAAVRLRTRPACSILVGNRKVAEAIWALAVSRS